MWRRWRGRERVAALERPASIIKASKQTIEAVSFDVTLYVTP